ncbi:Arc family DNA-binding protein [Pseudomonas parafulva]|uniref:Arc family DNA-binding protein n=1 Tax=Pseudomonas parafulva TaxID=157782 RepID=A0AAI8PD82_9PSED|nr:MULTISPECIES: Arc family DNA-binding protein [Pseudomonas]AXO90242.1 Arc family DNA-binding protein [Pseudomonas parafulva]MDV9030505.1 Arc family DNA-binding protein [Pseudomonas sp. RAC1]
MTMLKPASTSSRDADKFVVRLPDGMRDRIGDAARGNNRSMNSEIITRLERSLTTDGAESKVGEALMIYLPPALLSDLDTLAKENERSVNAEVTYRLKQSAVLQQLSDEQARLLGILRRRIEELENRLTVKGAA